MKSNKTTLIFQKNEKQFKLFKLIFHPDGSYFVTAPYHQENSAFVFKAVVDYRKHTQTTPFNEMIEKLELDDENLALKISHHSDGFLQFSGTNIRSGREADGTPKGMGIQSWRHDNPPHGPAFSITIKNINCLKLNDKISDENFIIDADTIADGLEFDDVSIEGFFIPINFIQYIFIENGREYVSLTHPTGLNLKLNVLRPVTNENCKGFFGINIQMVKLQFDSIECGFAFSTSTGDVKIQCGHIIKGTGMYAIYPNRFKDKFLLPTLNWK
jgi:hypothetical protein